MPDNSRIVLRMFIPSNKRARPNSNERRKFNDPFWRSVKTRKCHYCGSNITAETATQDHKIPVSKGSKMTKENIVFACKKCNQAKGSLPYEEFKSSMLPVKRTRKAGLRGHKEWQS